MQDVAACSVTTSCGAAVDLVAGPIGSFTFGAPSSIAESAANSSLPRPPESRIPAVGAVELVVTLAAVDDVVARTARQEMGPASPRRTSAPALP